MFRYKDDDIFPFFCSRCGEDQKKTIGWMKANTRSKCPGCKANLLFYKEDVRRALEELENAVGNFERNARLEDE